MKIRFSYYVIHQLSYGKILLNRKFPNKSYVEKIERLQNVIEEEKSIYVLNRTIGYEICDLCYEVFLVCYNCKSKVKPRIVSLILLN